MTWYLDVGLAGAAFGLVSGAFVPELIRPLPEPEPDPEGDELFEEEEPKELYADIARLPGLRWKAALVTAVVAGLLGARLDLSWELLAVIGLAPVGVALALVDYRTRYLPTWLIGPMYGVVLAVAALGSLVERDWSMLLGAAIGWAVYGGLFLLFWVVFPAGSFGFGDIRLAGLLGLALGSIGLGPLFVGMFLATLFGAVVGIVVRVALGKKYSPYGPNMLYGAVVGAMFGVAFARWYWRA